MKTLIVGLGNPILTDDGVGVKVAYQLQEIIDKEKHPHVTVIEVSAGGIRLMEAMLGYDRVILIDAFLLDENETKPGRIHRLTLDELRSLSPTQHSASAHDTTLVTALEAAQEMGYQTPSEVIIFAVEVENILDFSETPTPQVAKAIPNLVQLVMEEL
jgi:hydrogenase maturation protease